MTNQSASRPVTKSTRRRWLRWSLIFLLVFIGLPASYFWYARWSLERELAQVIAETDRLDPRWRLEDIEADRKIYRDEENAALQVIKVSRLVGMNLPTWHPRYAPAFEDLPSQNQLNAQQIELMRSAFDKMPEGVVEARKLKDMQGGRFPIVLRPEWISTDLSNQQNGRRVFGVLQDDAMLRAHGGDLDAALESCLALLNAANSLGDEPFVMSLLIRAAGEYYLAASVERCLAQGMPSDAPLKALQDHVALERVALRAHFVAALRGERAGSYQLFLGLGHGKFRLSQFGAFAGGKGGPSFWQQVRDQMPILYTKDFPAYLRYMNEIVAAVELPMEQQQERFRTLQQDAIKHSGFAAQLTQDLSRICDGHLRFQAMLATMEAGIVCERFRKSRKRWPEALAELVDVQLIDAVPTDPFNGQPLRLARRNDGITVYSVGNDQEDNGGNFDRNHPLSSGVDLGFRLWDPDKRRQPPRPPVSLKP